MGLTLKVYMLLEKKSELSVKRLQLCTGCKGGKLVVVMEQDAVTQPSNCFPDCFHFKLTQNSVSKWMNDDAIKK